MPEIPWPPADSLAEIHIAGLLVQAWPAAVGAVAQAIDAMPGLELAVAAEGGRLVVVSECASRGATLELIDRIRALPGVLDVALVYQHAESAGAMNEELSDETDPTRVH